MNKLRQLQAHVNNVPDPASVTAAYSTHSFAQLSLQHTPISVVPATYPHSKVVPAASPHSVVVPATFPHPTVVPATFLNFTEAIPRPRPVVVFTCCASCRRCHSSSSSPSSIHVWVMSDRCIAAPARPHCSASETLLPAAGRRAGDGRRASCSPPPTGASQPATAAAPLAFRGA